MDITCVEAQVHSFYSTVPVPLMQCNGLVCRSLHQLARESVSSKLTQSQRLVRVGLTDLSDSCTSGIIPRRHRKVLDWLPRVVAPRFRDSKNEGMMLLTVVRLLLSWQKAFRTQEQRASEGSDKQHVVQTMSPLPRSDKNTQWNKSTIQAVSWILIWSCSTGTVVMGVKAEHTPGGGWTLTSAARWIPDARMWHFACFATELCLSLKLEMQSLAVHLATSSMIMVIDTKVFSSLCNFVGMLHLDHAPSLVMTQALALPLSTFGHSRSEPVPVVIPFPCDGSMVPMSMPIISVAFLTYKRRHLQTKLVDGNTRPGKQSRSASLVEQSPALHRSVLVKKPQRRSRRAICQRRFVSRQMMVQAQSAFTSLASQPSSRKRGLGNTELRKDASKRPLIACTFAVSLKKRLCNRRCLRRRRNKKRQSLVLGAFATERTWRPDRKRAQKSINMIREDKEFGDEGTRAVENEMGKMELDESLHPSKKQRWTLMDDPDLSRCTPTVREAIRSLLSPGDGTQAFVIETFLWIIARACSGITAQATKYNFGDIKHFKQQITNSHEDRSRWHDFMRRTFSSAQLSFVFVHEENIECDYEHAAHASLLVIDRTRPGQERIIHFDSDPGKSQERQEFRECIEQIDFGSNRVKFFFGEAPLQDEDNGDCGVITCGTAAAYAQNITRSLNMNPMQAVERVIIGHGEDTEKLGYQLRSYVYRTVQHGRVIPVNMTAHFL